MTPKPSLSDRLIDACLSAGWNTLFWFLYLAILAALLSILFLILSAIWSEVA